MKPSILAEDILTLMVYGFNLFSRPTLHNWNQSSEGWLYQEGFLRRLQWLETQRRVERQDKRADWVYKLTGKGRLFANTNLNPESQWQRTWDGWWRQLIFDLPVEHKKARDQLIRWLRRNRFGYLQDSVWISPHPVKDVARAMREFRDDAGSFTIMESHCAPGFSNAALVEGAWPLGKIHEKHDAYLRFATSACQQLKFGQQHPRDLFRLLQEERWHWSGAFKEDPLLPRVLWPRDYQGEKAWRLRQRLLRALASQIPNNN